MKYQFTCPQWSLVPPPLPEATYGEGVSNTNPLFGTTTIDPLSDTANAFIRLVPAGAFGMRLFRLIMPPSVVQANACHSPVAVCAAPTT